VLLAFAIVILRLSPSAINIAQASTKVNRKDQKNLLNFKAKNKLPQNPEGA
jgi:hypothetical protein